MLHTLLAQPMAAAPPRPHIVKTPAIRCLSLTTPWLLGPLLLCYCRREWAHLAVEAALATGVLANLLGWPCLVSGRFQASSAWGSWHLLVALVLRAVLRKVGA
jgi:hypothetical protein